MNNNKKAIVIDSMMGTGKTSYAIQLMQEAPSDQKFIYVTPFLKEVDRVKFSVTNRIFTEPDVNHGNGKKLESLKKLVANGEDIVTTHALFGVADDELMDLISWENYTLIIDEVMEVVSQLPVRRGDMKMMKNSGTIEIDEATSQVIWKEDPRFDTTHTTVRDYALVGNLYEVNSTAFVWNFPAKMFRLFEQVYILTFLFDGQIQRYYYDMHGIQYDYYAVVVSGERYELKPKSEVPEDRSQLKALINIYEGKLNEIGDVKNSLSKSWFINKHNTEKVKKLKNNLANYYRHITKSNAENFLWTTFISGEVESETARSKKSKKTVKDMLKGKGFSLSENDIKKESDKPKVCFIPFTARATNEYKHKTNLAYCLNRFMNPIIEEHYFLKHGITVNEDLLALSDLLQWIFRSAIREGKPINIYIPSKRMRTLLKQWLDNEI